MSFTICIHFISFRSIIATVKTESMCNMASHAVFCIYVSSKVNICNDFCRFCHGAQARRVGPAVCGEL